MHWGIGPQTLESGSKGFGQGIPELRAVGKRGGGPAGLSSHPLSPWDLPHLVGRDTVRGDRVGCLAQGRGLFGLGLRGSCTVSTHKTISIETRVLIWIMESRGPMWQKKGGPEIKEYKKSALTEGTCIIPSILRRQAWVGIQKMTIFSFALKSGLTSN